MKRFWLALSILLFGFGESQAEYFTITNFDVHVKVYKAGYFTVTETIDVEFSQQRHGIFRDIPYRYIASDGEEKRVYFDDITVDNRPYETNFQNGLMRIKIGDPDKFVDGKQQYQISYTVEDGFFFFDDHSEFYWNLVGTEWPVTIDKISYKIEMAEPVLLNSGDYNINTGAYGSKVADASIVKRGNTLFGSSSRVFQPKEGLTVAIRFPKDHISEAKNDTWKYLTFLLLTLPLWLISHFKSKYDQIGRNRKRVEVVHFSPPEDISPSIAGGFIDDRADNEDLICLIPKWGAEGLLRMEEEEEKGFFGSNTEVSLHKTGEIAADVPSFESTIFNGLFDKREVVKMADLKEKFYTTMAIGRKQLKHSVYATSLYTEESMKQSKAGWPIAVCILAIIGGVFSIIFATVILLNMGSKTNTGLIVVGVAAIVSGVVGLVYQSKMLKRNDRGDEIWQQINGFKMFVERADEPKLRRLLRDDPQYFDKTLPFAVTFGLAKEWSSKFDGLFAEPPTWYHGSHMHSSSGNNFSNFATNIGSQVKTINSAFTSAPSSSGSGGGGSSGGGGGGGGGGSW